MAHISEHKSMFESASKIRLALRRPFSRVKTFTSDEDGAMYILAMFLFVVMLIFSGLAIDFMRYELHRTRLQATLDRAILAAANPDRIIAAEVGQEAARKAVVLDYFKRAGLEDTIDANSVTVEMSQGQSIVDASASLNITTPFLNWSGVSELSAPAAGRAEKGVALTEISLVLDVSGSMRGDKLTELKKAAIEFSNLLLCDPADASKSTDCTIPEPDVANGVFTKTSISLIPYAAYVNAGDELLQAFDPVGAHARNNCATFSEQSYGKIGVIPTPDALGLAAMSNEDKRDFLMHQSSAAMMARSIGSTSETGEVYRESTYLLDRTPCYRASDTWRNVRPFQHSAATLKTAVNLLQASGNTSIDVGLKWGTTLLHPGAEPVIDELTTGQPVLDADGDPVLDGTGAPVMTTPLIHETFRGRPYNPNSTSSRKIVVLMTDGFNTSAIEMSPEVRAGDSPFWVTKPSKIKRIHRDSGDVRQQSGGNVLSVYDSDTEKYQWHFVREDSYGDIRQVIKTGTSSNPFTKDHPFGTLPTDCINSDKTRRYWREICANYPDPTDPAEPRKLTYEQFWGEENYYPKFLENQFPWIENDVSLKVGSTAKNTRLLAQCSAAESSGIIVVTIDMSSGNSTMESCASTASLDGSAIAKKQYYPVSTTDIAETFRKLANDINKLRLTK